MKKVGLIILAFMLATSCADRSRKGDYHHWVVTGEVLSADPEQAAENVAVKDPSIVFAEGNYHLFYTAKSVIPAANGETYGIGCGYRFAETLDELSHARRISIDSMAGCTVIAPQVFYFAPQQKWYLVGHTTLDDGRLNRLEPVYLTNDDITDPAGWSTAQPILTGKKDQGFWIDFWVICEEQDAYLFYADQTGKLFRVRCALDDFPGGFAESTPHLALEVDRMNRADAWRFFEAAHIYYVADRDVYVAILEGARPHPGNNTRVDARNRFIFAMIADRLDGEWRWMDPDSASFFAEAGNMTGPHHASVPWTQVSHPELIRSGYDQRMEISSLCTQMIFQTFDGTSVPDDYNYNALPWKLMIMENCN